MSYAPEGKPEPVVKPGEFIFAAAHLDHGHINGQCNGLTEAGGQLKYIYDPDPAKTARMQERYPDAKIVESLDEILNDSEVKMVAAAAVPSERGPLGLKVMEAGKDYFTDKTPFTSMEQLEAARAKVRETGQKYMVYYSERLHVECAMHATTLIEQGVIGKVMHVEGFGPHRHGERGSRPEWFYQKAKYGGILCDIGSHQCEQFLTFTGAKDGEVMMAHVNNFDNPEYPELEDFGEASIKADNGATFYYRVDWFTPKGLRNWGDGRTFILGTEGSIELRKYIDVTTDNGPDQLILVTSEGEERMSLRGKVGFKFFGQLILDCLNRTENAMTQEHAFKAAELCLKCQEVADAARQ